MPVEFSDEKVVVGGDGQCDSPGFTAKNLCYFLMELTSGYILEIEVRDKRHVGLASTNMEKVALKNALTRLKRVLDVVEVATDASSSIKKLIANEFKDVFHSLDVWHKSKSIRKCLAKIGQAKAMAKIKAWSDHIIRHFWYCSSVCKESENTSDEEALQIMKSKWIGLLHHVCDSHEWLGGRCDHEDQIHDPNLTWFDRRDKDFAELQKVILNPELLDSFRFYVRFRHTGRIECANSLTLAYTPKRTPLSYKAYKARKYVATFDWNFHLDLPSATSKSGNEITSRRYNQRTKQWDVRTVKQIKTFDYIPLLIARMLRARVDDNDLVARNVSLNESDPRLVAPTIAAKPPPSSKELLERKSRFIVPSKHAKSTSNQDLGENVIK